MPTLDDLRLWLNMNEAAQWLSDLSKQKVTPYKLLRHALDNQITLSVYFPSGVMVVKDDEEPSPRYGLLDLDLSKFGSHRAWVERLYIDSCAPHFVQDTAAYLRDAEGNQLMVTHEMQPEIYEDWTWQCALPPDTILCIRAEILEQIKNFLCGSPSPLEGDLNGKSRSTFQIIIGAMLKEHGYNPHLRETTGTFMNKYLRAFPKIDPETIRNALRGAADKYNERADKEAES